MDYIQYKATCNMLNNFSNLTKTQQEIAMSLLLKGTHKGSYTDFTINRLNRKKSAVSEIRRMILDLQDRQLISIQYDPVKPHKVIQISLSDLFFDILFYRKIKVTKSYTTARR